MRLRLPVAISIVLVASSITAQQSSQAMEVLQRDTGRPSIDPELLLRMLLVGYLYGVTSERKLVEELGMQRLKAAGVEIRPKTHVIKGWH